MVGIRQEELARPIDLDNISERKFKATITVAISEQKPEHTLSIF